MNDKSTNKVYVLELIGDIVNTPGSVVLDVGGVSTDKEILETLKKEYDEELDAGLGDSYDEYEYMGYDLSDRPEWVITEYDLLTKK